jgi:Caspase domain/Glucodextranase, domain B
MKTLFLILLTTLSTFAQNFQGRWQGQFWLIDDSIDKAMIELEQNDEKITGQMVYTSSTDKTISSYEINGILKDGLIKGKCKESWLVSYKFDMQISDSQLIMNVYPLGIKMRGVFSKSFSPLNSNKSADINRPKPENSNVIQRSVSDKEAPTITILEPKTKSLGIGKMGAKSITIKAKVTDNKSVKTVFVNNSPVDLINDKFSTSVSLYAGKNVISILAIDNSGNNATEQIAIEIPQEDNNNPVAKPNNLNLKTENYYALFIANNDYKYISKLDNPIDDATKLKQVLQKKYGFEKEHIFFLTNQTRKEVISKLSELRRSLSESDNLLVYYSGHGFYDAETKYGYLIPIDGKLGDVSDYLSESDITNSLKAIKTNHTLLILDACFSGSMLYNTRNARENLAFEQIAQSKSRTMMTSGFLTEVPDKSAFAEYLVKKLNENKEKYLTDEELYTAIKIPVMSNSQSVGKGEKPAPQFGIISNTEHDGGSFIFIKK